MTQYGTLWICDCGQPVDGPGAVPEAGTCRHCGESCCRADPLCLECREAGACAGCGYIPVGRLMVKDWVSQ